MAEADPIVEGRYEYEDWYGLDVKPGDELENWSGAMDNSVTDNYGTDKQAGSINDPIEYLGVPDTELKYLSNCGRRAFEVQF